MIDYDLALMTGIDFPIPGCSLIIHQPSIEEISFLGEQRFFSSVQLLCINKSMYQSKDYDLSDVTNFDIFMELINSSAVNLQKQEVIQVLQLFFPSYKIAFTPRSILFNLSEETFILDEGNFEYFQKVLNTMLCLAQGGQQSFNPQEGKAQEIAQKLQRARQRVSAIKNAQNKNQGSVLGNYLSVITVGLGSMSLPQVAKLTIYQLYDLVERYSMYINWDMDIRSRLAGAKGDKPVENWMQPIH